MATYAAFKHVELYNVGKAKKRVLRPPGGGSSDIFGTDKPSTPRHTNNRMASNIFSADQNSSVKNNAPAPDYRRGQRNVDSYSRLFGEPDRSSAPAKNHMKSSIPINNGAGGNDSTDNAKRNQNGNHQNGYSNNTNTGFIPHKNKVENCSANGFIYGSGHHEAQQLQREQKEQRQEQQRQDREDQKYQAQDQQRQDNQTQEQQQQSRQEQQQSRQEQQQSRQEQQDQRQQVLDQRQQVLDQRQKAQDQQQRQQIGNGNTNGNGKSDLQDEKNEFQDNANVDQESMDKTEIKNDVVRNLENTQSSEEKHNLDINTNFNQIDAAGGDHNLSKFTSKVNTPRSVNIGDNNLDEIKEDNLNANQNFSNNDEDSRSIISNRSTLTAASQSVGGTALSDQAQMQLDSNHRAQTARNPVTGTGLESDNYRPRRGAANHRDGGNPVTGEGYNKNGEINTSIPSLNGANQVINRNRIPPGGYSSGLW